MLGNDREKIRHLLFVQDLQGQRTIPLKEATYSLGRDSRNAIVLSSRSVSRQHAILLRLPIPEIDNYGFRIIDGSFKGKTSTNGLFVNGTKCFSHDLKHGDVIVFGNNEAKAKYYAISDFSEKTFSQSCQHENLDEVISEQAYSINPFETLAIPDPSLEGSGEVALARLASFPELIPNPIIEIDLEGRVTYLNPAAASKFPQLREAGKHHPILAGLPTIVQYRENNCLVREVEVGKEVFEQSIHYLPESDLIRTFIVREITQQKQAEAELRQRDRLLQAVAEAANHLLVEMDLHSATEKALAALGEAAEADRAYLFANHLHPLTGEMAVSLKFEWTRPKLQPLGFHWQNQPLHDSALSRWYTVLSNGQSISGFVREFPLAEQELLKRDGIQSLLLVPLRLDDEFWGYLGLADCSKERYWSRHEESTLLTMAASISAAWQRQQVEAKIRYQALHDILTGLPNRLLFYQELSKAIPNAVRTGKSLAVMFLDLDRFKTINDTLGHTLGDTLLQRVAQRLRESIRKGDTIARWGGDEFTILLPQMNSIEDVTQIALRILQNLENVFDLEQHELYVSASLGIALFDQDSPDVETLIQHADTALYYAKEQGRNNYQFYTPALSAKAPELLTLQRSLRHALEREELLVYYQPRVNIISGKITGMEALVRWLHPEMGLVAPSVFIPLAEESGLIIPIGEWVLLTACRQNKAWQDAGLPPLTMAVNLSPKQFRQPNLVDTVARILQETGLEPHFLELEITESTAIADLDFTKAVLHELEEMGVHLSIDDFGTGHSSLSRLQLLPLHNLKIDRSFIRDLTTDVKVAHIVTAIVKLGQSLGLRLTAEGVENEAELDFLRSINCEDVQGFFFYRPLSATKATEVLENQNILPLINL
ncbi:EAL domain-containing protein [Aetokthonos hydrillicola Thurmond2011]|jgi:diguanylate cyclase (GGDEF)-like protein|uniref:EAL domain-containing protein n=2 Tax=Aetokthonos TaxID=1550243 RepID=A0AAP5IDQ0_9CYAN|nr:EAL domain-containing protein [Aetokthonos hydrillicola]MBO3462048.1 EAL domain-containing protein [Aetokthonos hydrillicola CCALA 1050]MBW4589345.1 EAL domain-containing protein [Aetokthonos hydrillicola CCALA 1050]MDR9898122.1 EAL domain-containing protein [Aetokthonos hydrillicola Thurmond2011]